MNRVRLAPTTILAPLHPVRIIFLILCRGVVAALTLTTGQRNNGAHVLFTSQSCASILACASYPVNVSRQEASGDRSPHHRDEDFLSEATVMS